MASTSSHHEEDDEDLGIDYSEIEEKYALDPDSGFDNILVIDNIPLIDQSKRSKLLERLRQLFAKAGAPLEGEQAKGKEGGDDGWEDMDMPWDEEKGSNKGYIFLTYPSESAATHALRSLDQTLFGKNRLHVNKFGDIERFAGMHIEEGGVPRGWVEEGEWTDKEHLKSWLADTQGRDQYVTFRDQYVDVFWNGRGGVQEQAVKSQPRWGELVTGWSPQGTYFSTLHRIGVALWAGKSFSNDPIHRFEHAGVRLIDFSPCEQYLVTFSPDPIVPAFVEDESAPLDPRKFGPEDEGHQIAVWEVKTGFLLRTFPGEPPSPPQKENEPAPRKMAWPLLRWSPDDKYVARCNLGHSIAVYELPGMGLLDRKSIKIEGVCDFSWNPDKELGATAKDAKEPKENMFAFWTPEEGNQPARASLMGIPSRQILRSKNLFNVKDCNIHWQDQGAYMAVRVDRYSKSKKNLYSNLEIFRVKEKNYPVETLELKDVATQFLWEPSGSRFCLVTTNDPSIGGNVAPGVVMKNNIEFFGLDPKKGDFKMLKALTNKTNNTIVWAPKGRFIVIATVGSSAKSDIEFWDLDFSLDDAKKEVSENGLNLQLLATGDHYGMSEVSWDPSGRYLASVGSAWVQSPEPGYVIWSFRGEELQRLPQDKFKQLVWRPRPSTLLPKEEQRKVRKNLREYSRAFDEEDAAEESNVSAELLAQRRRLVDEWNAWRSKRIRELEQDREAAGVNVAVESAADEEKEQVQEWTEELIDETEEVVVG